MSGGAVNWYLEKSFDYVVNKLVAVDSVHYEVHEGKMYTAEYSASIANGNSVELLITVGEDEAHTSFGIAAGGQVTIYLFEGTAKTAGTAITARNLNRTKSDAHTKVTVTHTPAGAGDGTAIINGRLLPGGASQTTRIGGSARANSEMILRPNTKYLLRVTNTSGSGIDINPTLEYYEE